MNLVSLIHWTTPLMLGGLSLLALPLIAHLLNRRSRRRIVFPTIRLLHQTVADQAQLLKLRRWLLLLLRAIAVALIVIAFARPTWFAGRSESAGERKCVAIVIDTSLSTQQRDNGVAAFDSLKATAARLLSELDEGKDIATVIYASRSPESVFGKLSGNLQALRESVSQSQAGSDRTDWTSALRIAYKELAEADGRRQIFVISDLQKSNWEEFDDNRISWAVHPLQTEVAVVDFRSNQPVNLSVSNPTSSPQFPLLDQNCVLTTTVNNHSKQAQQVAVTLRVDGQVRDKQNVTLQPKDSQEASFVMRIEKTDPYLIEFEIGDDALSDDNRSYVVVGTQKNIPALIVTDDDLQPGSGAYYLSRAMQPFVEQGNLFDVQLARPGQISSQLLSGHRLVMLGYIGSLSDSQVQTLLDFVQGGGALFMICGEGNVATNVAQFDALSNYPDGFLPLRLGRLDRFRQSREWLTITGGKWRNSLLDAFDQRSQVALGQIHFRQAWQVTGIHPAAEVLLTYSDGRAALAICDQGQGRVAMANFSLAAEQSDFAKYGSFVALIQMVASRLSSNEQGTSRWVVGESIQKTLDIKSEVDLSQVVVRDPNGDLARAMTDEEDGRLAVSLLESDLPGFYRIDTKGPGGQDNTIDALAVNVDHRESDLEQIDRQQLSSRFASQDTQVVKSDRWNDDLTDDGKPYWPILIATAIGLLLLESSLLAWWKN